MVILLCRFQFGKPVMQRIDPVKQGLCFFLFFRKRVFINDPLQIRFHLCAFSIHQVFPDRGHVLIPVFYSIMIAMGIIFICELIQVRGKDPYFIFK